MRKILIIIALATLLFSLPASGEARSTMMGEKEWTFGVFNKPGQGRFLQHRGGHNRRHSRHGGHRRHGGQGGHRRHRGNYHRRRH